MTRKIIVCKYCKQEKEHHAKEMCYKCYKKHHYKKKLSLCQKCKKLKPHHAFGLCSNCYLKEHKYDQVKSYNARKYHNLSLGEYRKITKYCIICGFDKIVELHHLDKNHQNTNSSNLIGLCPNHHKMLHNENYSVQIQELIKKHLILQKSES